MKLSEQTVSVLKNFSSINNAIRIPAGNEIRSMAVTHNIIGIFKCEEEFSSDFAVADVKKFLLATEMVPDANLDFDEHSVQLSDNKSNLKVQYFFCDPSLVVFPEKEPKIEKIDATFEISEDQLKKVMTAASSLELPDLVFSGDGEKISVSVFKSKLDTSNKLEIVLCESSEKFNHRFIVDRLKMVPGNYVVSLTECFGKFEHKDMDLTYFIAMNPDE